MVTGASAGIGLVTARELVRQGARVLGVGRSPERCALAARQIRQDVGTGEIDYLIADLSSQADIRRLAGEIKERTPRLDVLINNAGGIFLERLETVDGHEMTFALNHLAYFLLTNLLLGLLKASAPARIVSVASAA
ncbi:MAG: SDR family NAD(P)-dependent oxidoreductase, partial [Isosphaeraceae bacterium]